MQDGRNDLYEQVLPEVLPRIVARYGRLKVVELDDVLAEAKVGAWNGVSSFDPTKGVPLSAWCYLRASWQVGRLLRSVLGRQNERVGTARRGTAEAMNEAEQKAPELPRPARPIPQAIYDRLGPVGRKVGPLLVAGYTPAEAARAAGCLPQQIARIRRRLAKQLAAWDGERFGE